MEIQKIEICNLNSLKGEFCIDFMSGQLKGQDIFAITGATGSGKSTILDAITLALYNRIPRLDGKKGDGNPKSKDPYERLAPADTENALTRGEKKGCAKVVFEVAGQRYRAEWLCELKNVTFGGSHTLFRLRNENGAEKAEQLVSGNLVHEFDRNGTPKNKTVSKEVVDLIGLGYDQFCKACILAQNSFANFLKANDFEKADILEKITGTSIYGRIAGVIVDGYDGALREKKEIDDKIGGQRDLMVKDEEELVRLKAGRDSLVKERDDLKKKIGELEKGVEWWNGLDALAKKKEEAEAKKNEAEENERKLIPEQTKLVRYDKVGEGLKLLDAETDAQRELGNADKNLAGAQRRLQENQDKISSGNEKKAEAEEELEARKSDWEKLAWIRPVKENIALIRHEYARLGDSVQELRKAASLHAPESGYDGLGKKDLLENVARLTGVLTPEMTRETEQARLEKARKERTVCENAGALHPLLEKVLEIEARDKVDEETIASLRPLQKELEEDIPALTAQITSLENENFVIKRGLLKEGEPCELCGAVHHPYATPSVFNERIESIRTLLKEKSKKKEEVDNQIGEARNGISNRDGQKTAMNVRIKDLKAKMEAGDDSFRTVFSKYSTEAQISGLKSRADEKAAWEKEEAAAENTLSLILLHDLLERIRGFQETLDKYLPETWRSRWLENDARYAQDLENDVKSFLEAEKKFTQADQDVRDIQTAIDTLTKLIPKLEDDIKQQEVVRKEKKELLDKAGEDLSRWIGTFNAREENPVSREELDSWKEDKTDWNALRKTVKDAENERITHSALFGQAAEELQAHQDREDRPAEEKEKLEERKSAVRFELEEGPESVVKRLEAVSGRLATHEAAEKAIAEFKDSLDKAERKVSLWKRFYNMLGDGKGDKEAKEFRKLAQNYTLGLLLSYANEELGKFTKRYTLKKQNDSSLEIMVLDGELGERYSSSLSGGETFMVSLALALGLSSISSGSVTLKNIFIDEGFGSLDSDTQKTVVGALNTLRMQGKRIGLISHTAALLGDDSIYKIKVRKVDDKFSVIDPD